MKAKHIIPAILLIILAIGTVFFLNKPKAPNTTSQNTPTPTQTQLKIPDVTDWKKEFTPVKGTHLVYQAIITKYSGPPQTRQFDNCIAIDITDVKFNNGNVYYTEQQSSTSGEKVNYYFIIKDDGVYQAGCEKSVNGKTVQKEMHSSPFIVIKFPLELEKPFKVNQTVFGNNFNLETKLAAYTSIQVPAGEFKAYQIKSEGIKGGSYTKTENCYVPGIGLIKTIEDNTKAKTKFELNLTEYNIPKDTAK